MMFSPIKLTKVQRNHKVKAREPEITKTAKEMERIAQCLTKWLPSVREKCHESKFDVRVFVCFFGVIPLICTKENLCPEMQILAVTFVESKYDPRPT